MVHICRGQPLTNLARLLDTFPHAKVRDNPRYDQAADHAPVQAAHVVDAVGNAQDLVLPKLLRWRRPLGNGRHAVCIVLVVPDAAAVALLAIGHAAVGGPLAALHPRQLGVERVPHVVEGPGQDDNVVHVENGRQRNRSVADSGRDWRNPLPCSDAAFRSELSKSNLEEEEGHTGQDEKDKVWNKESA